MRVWNHLDHHGWLLSEATAVVVACVPPLFGGRKSALKIIPGVCVILRGIRYKASLTDRSASLLAEVGTFASPPWDLVTLITVKGEKCLEIYVSNPMLTSLGLILIAI